MKKERLALLLGYIQNQQQEINTLINAIKEIEPIDKEKSVFLGYHLHNLYCAFEDIFKEVAKTFENTIEDPTKYHRELLRRMVIDVPGIRRNLLSKSSARILDELRSFRHVFRHSYMYEIEGIKVQSLKEKLLENNALIQRDIGIFMEFLKNNIE